MVTTPGARTSCSAKRSRPTPARVRRGALITAALVVLSCSIGCGNAAADTAAAQTRAGAVRSMTTHANRTAAVSRTVAAGAALRAARELAVKGRAPLTGYSRARFGPAWADVNRNGCDTRNDILRRDLRHLVYRVRTHGCVVSSGDLRDPYTGRRIHFVRGVRTSLAVQIDHVVALADAWQTGAQKWGLLKREVYANDPLVLLAVDGRANEAKGASDAASWLPANKAFRCRYVARQVAIKQKYRLWATSAEKAAIVRILDTCPGQPLPKPGASVASMVARDPAFHSGSSATSKPAPKPSGGGTAVYYANCTAVRAAGKAPLYKGQPGYSTKLDRDHDGIACE